MTNVPHQPPPLAELHCHLEGTVEPTHARRLAKRHGVDISDVLNEDGGYHWDTFEHFLHVYDAVSEVLRTPEDYCEITRAYYTRMAARGMIYGEVFVSPAHAARFGLSYPTLIDAVASAMQAAEDETGVVGRIVVTCVRHYGVDHAVEVARAATDHPHPYVTGFGMAGDEAQGCNADFAKAFAIARDGGLGLTAHAGEILGPESISEALDHLGVTRLGHGVRVLEDDALVARLIEQDVVLEICPTSNVSIGLFPSIEAHPIKALADKGLAVTLNSDDPAFFGVDLADEAALVGKAHKFDETVLLGFTQTAINAAFCDSQTRARLLARLEQ
ncbi:MAG: adenosine deaminase [Parvularculaceae bacterium]